MKAISLYQPWASLVALELKWVETRSWETKYRGPLAIHAAKRSVGINDGPWDDFTLDQYEATRGHVNALREGCEPLPLGAVVATCELVDCIPIWGPMGAPEPGVVRYIRVGGPWTGQIPGRASLKASADRYDYRDIDEQIPYGDFTPGRFAWLFEEIRLVDPPVSATGHQGLWEWAA